MSYPTQPTYIGMLSSSAATEEMAVYRDPGGGIFAIDASYLEQDAGPVFSPFNGIEFDPDEAEK